MFWPFSHVAKQWLPKQSFLNVFQKYRATNYVLYLCLSKFISVWNGISRDFQWFTCSKKQPRNYADSQPKFKQHDWSLNNFTPRACVPRLQLWLAKTKVRALGVFPGHRCLVPIINCTYCACSWRTTQHCWDRISHCLSNIRYHYTIQKLCS